MGAPTLNPSLMAYFLGGGDPSKLPKGPDVMYQPTGVSGGDQTIYPGGSSTFDEGGYVPGSTGTSTIGGGGTPAVGSTSGSTGNGNFDLAKFLQTIGAAGSAAYNAYNAGNAAQGVANTVDPFAGQRPYYQDMLKQNIGTPNPYASIWSNAYENQQNPYSAQYQTMLGNQSNPYASMIQQQWGKQDNPYAAQLQGLLTDPNSFKEDPGYQFALSQGQKGIERASNALYGTARTGSLAPELAKFTEGYAAQSYNDRINQLAGLTNAQNSYNANSMNTLANLSGQQQTTNTNQLGQIANLIGNTNSYNLGNLGAITSMFGAQGNQQSNLISQLLTAAGATTGSPTAAGAALQSGQQGQNASIGALLQTIPQLAPFVPQILSMLGGASSGYGNINFPSYGIGGPGAPQTGGPGGDDLGGPAIGPYYATGPGAPQLGGPGGDDLGGPANIDIPSPAIGPIWDDPNFEF